MSKVRWTSEAVESLDHILDEIEERFSSRIAEEFLKKVHETLKTVESYPESFPIFRSKKLMHPRKAVIHPHSTVFYRIEKDQMVTLLTFWDNRDNPEKID